MDSTQPWYESRTVWSALLTIAFSLLVIWGIDLPFEVKEALLTLIVLAGPSVVIWGRAVARKALRWW